MSLEENMGGAQHDEGRNPATDRLLPTTGYLPLSPVSRISVSTAIISLGVIDEKLFTRQCITKGLLALDERLKIVTFATCKECLEGTEGTDLVLYHMHDSISSGNNNSSVNYLKELLDVVPVIILSAIQSTDTLFDFFESGARGFISTDNITLEQIIDVIELVKAGGVFVAITNLSLRRQKKQALTATPRSRDQFTPSELAVLDRLKLGKANKAIAHELGLSEHTVKAHLGNIMRKLRVTNRTQIVCRTYAPATVRTLSSRDIADETAVPG